jgi:glyoxylase-like metal-dependent hydrolase (beta-lactamase superfamily II)
MNRGLPDLVSRAADPVYEIYAFKYAINPAVPKSIFIFGGGLDGEVLKNIPYSYWVIVGNGKKIAFDTGYSDVESAKKRGFVNYQSPKEMLSKINLKPEEITDVVISHMHWDHAGNVPAFANAEKIWIQREEFEFTTGRGLQSRLTIPFLKLEDIMEVLKANAVGRVELLEGDHLLFPGIVLYAVPRGHSYASQFMVVNTRSGPVVMAADCASTWDNINTNTPGVIAIDLLEAEKGIKKMRSFVKETKDIIPGHEPRVFEVYPQIAPGVAKIR